MSDAGSSVLTDARIGAMELLFDEKVKRLEIAISAVNDKSEVRYQRGKEEHATAMTSLSTAVDKAEKASEKRFDSVNEFRETLADQTATLLPRAEAETRFGGLSQNIERIGIELTKIRDHMASSSGKNQVWAVVGSGALSIAAIVVLLISTFHTPAANPNVGADTTRVTDLIAQMTANNATQDARMNALSTRLNQLTPPLNSVPPIVTVRPGP